MIKRILAILLLLIILLVGIKYFNDWRKTRLDRQALDNFYIYKQVGEALVENQDSIMSKLHLTTFDVLSNVERSTIFGCSNSYFVHDLLPSISDIPDMKRILPLCRDSISAEQSVTLETHSLVVFEIKSFDGFFILPGTVHYIVYDPERRFNQVYSASNRETIRKEALGKNWAYIIQRIYWDD